MATLAPPRTSDRPLFDRSNPEFDSKVGFVYYPSYTPLEVAQILALGDDKVRMLFRDGAYGEVIFIQAQFARPHRRNYQSIRIPFPVIVNFLDRHRKGGR